MIETAVALVFAHALGDFVFQTAGMVRRKKETLVLLLHVSVVAAITWLALGLGWAALVPVGIVAGSHLAIDAYKIHLLSEDLASFVSDQAAHLIVLAAVAFAFPQAYGHGPWPAAAAVEAIRGYLPHVMAAVAGLVIATRAGSFAIGLLMAGLPPLADSDSLPTGGRVIGLLERTLVFLFVLSGQAAVIGFLIAAKSVLRFGEVQKDRRAAEYVIIGTLASFAWAFAVALLAQAALAALPGP